MSTRDLPFAAICAIVNSVTPIDVLLPDDTGLAKHGQTFVCEGLSIVNSVTPVIRASSIPSDFGTSNVCLVFPSSIGGVVGKAHTPKRVEENEAQCSDDQGTMHNAKLHGPGFAILVYTGFCCFAILGNELALCIAHEELAPIYFPNPVPELAHYMYKEKVNTAHNVYICKHCLQNLCVPR